MRMLLAIATIVDGLLAGASVDQSVEQLPARHRIGVRAYQQYSQASHMANGRFWLIPLGIGGPLLRIAAALRAASEGCPANDCCRCMSRLDLARLTRCRRSRR